MKKTLIVALSLTLIAGALAMPAAAKKKKKAKAVATTLYLHGNYPVGEGAEFAGSIAETTHMKMDSTEPTDPAPKSMTYSFPLGNDQCTGNTLFPSWEGNVSGKITGDVTWIANFASAPGTATARLWLDIPFQSCTSGTAGVTAFVEPLSSVDVAIPAGQNEVEIVFEDIDVSVLSNMIVEIHQTSPASQGRILYDSPAAASRLEFNCIPTSGQSCTP